MSAAPCSLPREAAAGVEGTVLGFEDGFQPLDRDVAFAHPTAELPAPSFHGIAFPPAISHADEGEELVHTPYTALDLDPAGGGLAAPGGDHQHLRGARAHPPGGDVLSLLHEVEASGKVVAASAQLESFGPVGRRIIRPRGLAVLTQDQVGVLLDELDEVGEVERFGGVAHHPVAAIAVAAKGVGGLHPLEGGGIIALALDVRPLQRRREPGQEVRFRPSLDPDLAPDAGDHEVGAPVARLARPTPLRRLGRGPAPIRLGGGGSVHDPHDGGAPLTDRERERPDHALGVDRGIARVRRAENTAPTASELAEGTGGEGGGGGNRRTGSGHGASFGLLA